MIIHSIEPMGQFAHFSQTHEAGFGMNEDRLNTSRINVITQYITPL